LIGYAQSGSLFSVDIDDALLNAAVDEVVDAAAALSPQLRGEALHAEPSEACWTCDHLERCEPGQGWTAHQPRRRSGLLL
jgi:hypothetical protein